MGSEVPEGFDGSGPATGRRHHVRHRSVWLELRETAGRVEALQRQSAALLRTAGRVDPARRAERFAAHQRFIADEPQAARRLSTAAVALDRAKEPSELWERALEAGLSLVGADFGNVQILDAGTGSLRIVAHHGFDAEFLEYFAIVDDNRTACGRASRGGAQVVIVDVAEDERFTPHRPIAAAAGFSAVQSTPVADLHGSLVGVISTHWRRRHRPSSVDLTLLRYLAERVGTISGRFEPASGPG